MLTRHCSQFHVVKLFILTVALFVFGGTEALGQVTYNGNGNTGFGGVLGPGSFDISDDGTTVTLTFNKGSDDFNDALVVYIDSESGGVASTSSFTDTGDNSRQAVSGYDGSNRSTVNFPAGFRPDFAISANVNSSDANFNNLFGLVENGSHSFVDVVNINPSSGVGNSTYTMTFDFSEINTSSGTESFSFVATYLNEGSAFRSDEAIGDGIGSGNPGQNPVTFDTYFQYSSGDEGGLATTAQTGNWSDAATWTNGNVPLSGDDVVINHDVTLNTDATVSALTISSGNAFTGSDGTNSHTLTVTNGGTFTNNGTFTRSDGVVAFSGGNATVSGTVGFNDVTASTGVDFGSGSTINGSFTINGGGFVNNGNPPTYDAASTLVYNTDFGRGDEWSATSGAGHPANVTIQNNSTVDLSANGGASTAREMAGDLTINGGSELTMDDMSEALTVDGNVTVNSNGGDGTLTLGSNIGGDLFVRGDFTLDGTFNGNTRLVEFDGSSNQTISGSTDPSIDFFEINNSNGVTIDGSTLTVPNTLTLDQGTISQTNSGDLTLPGGSTVERSNGSLGFTPSFGGNVNVTYLAGVTTGPELSASNLNNLEVNASSAVTLASSLNPTVAGNLTLTNGTLADNGNTITLNGDATASTGTSITGSGSLLLTGGSDTYLLQGEGTYGDIELDESDDFSNADEAEVNGGATLGNVTVTNGVFDVQDNGATVNGNVDATSGGTFQISGASAVDVNGNVTVDGTLNLSLAGGGDLRVAGDFTMNGTFNDNGRLVDFDGSSAQAVGGTADPISIAFVEINNSNGVTLNTGVLTSDLLTLTDGTLTTNGNLTFTSTSETSTASIAGSGGGSVSGDVTFERFLDKGDDASHFRFLSAPTETLLDDEGSGSNAGNLLSNMWTQSSGTDTGADAEGSTVDPSVFTYDEGFNIGSNEDLSDGWTGVTNLNSGTGDFTPGTGFLAFMFADQDADGTNEGFPLTLSATGQVQTEENSGSIDLSSQITFTSDDDDTNQNGWNLIANPFMAPIDWESIESDGTNLDDIQATIYVYDAANGDYATYMADDNGTNGTTGGTGTQGRYIAPFQAFFVKATGGGSDGDGDGPDINDIDSGDKSVDQSPSLKGASSSPPTVKLRLHTGDDDTPETTAFRFAEGAAPGNDAYDAYQLRPFGNFALVASKMDGTDALFDIQSRPVPAEADTIDLALDITEGGTYSLTASALENLPGDWQVILENTNSGARWDLGAGESATFSVEGTQSKSTAEDVSPAALLKDGPTVAKASTDNGLPSYRLFVGPAAALPVELASFDATTEGTKVQLSWQTASETNNAGFAIERRAQGGTWSQVGSRDGAGTTTEAQTYRFTDENLPFEAEQVRYRLRQEDLDGSTTLSDEVTVDLGAPSKARLHPPFPNPSAQQATVRYEVPQAATVEIAVYDVLGRRVETVVNGQVPAGREQRTLQTGTLAPGTYFVRMRLGDTVHTERLTVVR